MLESLITSKTRVKLLLKFFLNAKSKSYLRSLAKEFGESTNSVRVELNRLTKAGLLKSEESGRTVVYSANESNPLFPEIHNLVKKNLGLDAVEMIISKLGNVKSAFITGEYAEGKDNGIIDLLIVGKINGNYLNELIVITEESIKRKIRTVVLSEAEYAKLKDNDEFESALLLWKSDKEL
jgi:DNA-binding transcriptional ArsR family regulator